MVYAHEHVLLRFNGHFGLNASTMTDKWSCGLRLGIPGSSPTYDAGKLAALAEAAKTAATTFHQAANTSAGTSTFFDQVAAAQIGVTGRYSPLTQVTQFSTVAGVAGIGTPTLPWNSALVFSLRTAIPRGRASNGRVYWPCLSMGITATTGRVSATNVQNRVNNFKTMLDSINTAANTYFPGLRVIVASQVGTGAAAVVTQVRSDDRVDSIERRENDQASVWGTATLS